MMLLASGRSVRGTTVFGCSFVYGVVGLVCGGGVEHNGDGGATDDLQRLKLYGGRCYRCGKMVSYRYFEVGNKALLLLRSRCCCAALAAAAVRFLALLEIPIRSRRRRSGSTTQGGETCKR